MREARLAGPSRADDREHARVALEHERDGVEELALAAEEARRRASGGRRCPACAAAGSSPSPSWKSRVGTVEVLQPVQAEVDERLAVEERGRGRGEDDLAAVCERGHPRAAMHVDADVALVA